MYVAFFFSFIYLFIYFSWPNSRSVNDFNESEAERDKSAKSSGGGNPPCIGSSTTQNSGLGGNVETEKKRVNTSVQVRKISIGFTYLFVYLFFLMIYELKYPLFFKMLNEWESETFFLFSLIYSLKLREPCYWVLTCPS